MKKSKIIIPALGVLVLSTAASITGTVAWFTANRSATITVNNFAVVKTDGNLDAVCSYGVGTAITNSDGKPIVVNPVTEAKIGDVSFNPATKMLYTDKGSGDAGGYRELGTSTSYSTQPASSGIGTHAWRINDKTYHAFTWKVRLTYEWGADHTALNIFFDYKDSTMTDTAQAGGDAAATGTKTGFRIAMIGESHTVVWAGLQTAANLKGVYGTGANNYDTYGGTNLSNNNFSYFASDKLALGNVAVGSATKTKATFDKAVDGDASQSGREDYLGTISYNNENNAAAHSVYVADEYQNKNYTDIWCVAWYEGTDLNVADDHEMDQVQSSLKFYAAINNA